MTRDTIFIDYAFNKISQAIGQIPESVTSDIYALSFWKDNNEDDPRRPSIIFGYNTISHFNERISRASDESEAKWNFAFWLQNEEYVIDDNDTIYKDWIIASPFYCSNEEQDMDLFFDLSQRLQGDFMKLIIKISKKLHKEGIVKSKFGKEIPIIIHELEYYALPLTWTKSGNPKGIITDFERWMRSFGV